MTETPAITNTFYRPCTNCGKTIEVVAGTERSHDCDPHPDMGVAICRAYWAGHDRAKDEVAAPVIDGSTSDGFHTFDELYLHRMLLNAALFNQLGADAHSFGLHRSLLHNDGAAPFGGGWFIVMATLPTGQISYHYELDHWDLFWNVPELDRALPWDGHTSEQAADRLLRWLQGES